MFKYPWSFSLLLLLLLLQSLLANPSAMCLSSCPSSVSSAPPCKTWPLSLYCWRWEWGQNAPLLHLQPLIGEGVPASALHCRLHKTEFADLLLPCLQTAVLPGCSTSFLCGFAASLSAADVCLCACVQQHAHAIPGCFPNSVIEP